MNTLPSIISFFSIACGISMITLAALVQATEPREDSIMLHKCMKIHPERYCRLTYAPSTVKTMVTKWMFNAGDIVDLNDRIFGWRGQYIVMAKKVDTPLIKIKNMGTNSTQFVSADRLRRSRLSQFFVKSLLPKW